VSTATHPGSGPPPGVDHPSLIPALLLADSLSGPDSAEDRPRGPVRRTARDWVVDVGVFLAALVLGPVLVVGAASQPDPSSDLLIFFDMAVGLLGIIALWWRRRWPVGVALLLAAIGTFSDMSGAAVLIALFTVAVHRPTRTVLAIAAANLVSFVVYVFVRGLGADPPLLVGLGGLVLLALVVAWGMFVRARRQLVHSLRDRAVRAESEQRLRVEQARQLERTRIAREMHDVLAHRLSLLSMHAGALEFRPDAPPAEVARAAGVVRASARAALEDLREVIGVLRDTTDGETSDGASGNRPQPTLGDLPALVEESRQAGLRVHEEYRLPALDPTPSVSGRTAYRVVQEGLTNVRKHSPGALATVVVDGVPGESLIVEVRNPPPVGEQQAPLPSAGTGLIGLLERVGLAGGSLEHGWTTDGDFRLRARLPWPETAAPAPDPV
jgi:signal transduction histidine kinase